MTTIFKCRQCETKSFFCDVIKDIYDWSVVQTTDLKDDVYLYNNDVYLYNNDVYLYNNVTI